MENVTVHYYRYRQERKVEPIVSSVIPYYDLTMVLEGSMEYRINYKKVTLRPNDLILMPPGTRRERFLTSGRVTYVSFNFLTDDPIDLPLTIEGAVGKEIRMMVYACNEINRDHGEYARYAFIDLLSAIINAIHSFVTRSKTGELTRKILTYIQENYYRPLSLLSIAKEMAYSVVYCDQLFRKDVGTSIVRYLIDYRIARAKEFLIENVLSLKEIAEKTGFGESNYFARQFRKRTGLSPMGFRKQFNR